MSRSKTSGCPSPKPDIRVFPNARFITRARGNDYRGWAIYTDGGARVVDGETLAGWGVISRSPHGRIDVMFGPVVTTEAHPAFSGARTHSDNTAEMTAMIDALYGISGNLGNECADHAAALGILGFTSSHNGTRWIHHNFDATACFGGCHSITEILEQLQRIRTDAVSLSQHRN